MKLKKKRENKRRGSSESIHQWIEKTSRKSSKWCPTCLTTRCDKWTQRDKGSFKTLSAQLFLLFSEALNKQVGRTPPPGPLLEAAAAAARYWLKQSRQTGPPLPVHLEERLRRNDSSERVHLSRSILKRRRITPCRFLMPVRCWRGLEKGVGTCAIAATHTGNNFPESGRRPIKIWELNLKPYCWIGKRRIFLRRWPVAFCLDRSSSDQRVAG